MQSELHNMSCYCYEATDGWSKRRFLLITNEKTKTIKFMEDLCKKRSDSTEKWTYKESDLTDSAFLNAKVLL